MKLKSSVLSAISLTFALLSLSTVCRANVQYTLIPDLVQSVLVTGSITTNGKIGILSSSDILGYSISLQIPGSGIPTETLSSTDPTGAGFYVLGNYLTATSSAISWYFAQGDGAEASIYGDSNITQWHLYTNRIDVDFNGLESASYRDGNQQIGTVSVPEPGTLALLGAGAGMLGWRRNRRSKPGALAQNALKG